MAVVRDDSCSLVHITQLCTIFAWFRKDICMEDQVKAARSYAVNDTLNEAWLGHA
jgi:hypothetical protein